jgi:hypothetical protein
MEGKMADKYDLRDWVIEALTANGKKGTIVDVCRFIWEKYENADSTGKCNR